MNDLPAALVCDFHVPLVCAGNQAQNIVGREEVLTLVFLLHQSHILLGFA